MKTIPSPPTLPFPAMNQNELKAAAAAAAVEYHPPHLPADAILGKGTG